MAGEQVRRNGPGPHKNFDGRKKKTKRKESIIVPLTNKRWSVCKIAVGRSGADSLTINQVVASISKYWRLQEITIVDLRQTCVKPDGRQLSRIKEAQSFV